MPEVKEEDKDQEEVKKQDSPVFQPKSERIVVQNLGNQQGSPLMIIEEDVEKDEDRALLKKCFEEQSDAFAVIQKRGLPGQRIQFSDLLYSNEAFYELINIGFPIKQQDLSNRIFELSGNDAFEFQSEYLDTNTYKYSLPSRSPSPSSVAGPLSRQSSFSNSQPMLKLSAQAPLKAPSPSRVGGAR